jgi:hypothetical protein
MRQVPGSRRQELRRPALSLRSPPSNRPQLEHQGGPMQKDDSRQGVQSFAKRTPHYTRRVPSHTLTMSLPHTFGAFGLINLNESQPI